MKTIPVLEALLVGLTPVLVDEIPPKGQKEGLIKKTYIIQSFSGYLNLPKDTRFTRIAASGNRPEYQHAKVAEAHVHLVEGVTREDLENDESGVALEIRLRTVEPRNDRAHAVRNYEFIVRAAPAKEGLTSILFLEPSKTDGVGVTKVKVLKDEVTKVWLHKGAELQLEPLDLPDEEDEEVLDQPA